MIACKCHYEGQKAAADPNERMCRRFFEKELISLE